METPREEYLRIKKEEEEKQYAEVMEKSQLTPAELWALTGRNFQAWRRKHDYPKLLGSFDEKIPSFIRWKSEYDITNEEIMECSISDFVGYKKLEKEKTLYLLEQTFDGEKCLMVCYADLSKEEVTFPTHGESYRLIKTFISYSDWCNSRKIKDGLFNVKQRQSPGHPLEKVWLDTGYELLKMGGIKPPMWGSILMRGKHLEFVNLSGLIIEGEINFGEEGNLSISYSTFDNVVCRKLEMPNLSIEYSSITDLSVNDSKIQQWKLWQCMTTGNIIDSKLLSVTIIGGQFTPFFKNVNIFDVDADHGTFNNVGFQDTYSTFKKKYADQGNQSKATEYYIKEKDLDRKNTKRWKRLPKTMSYYYWGYGKKPYRIIYISVAAILLAAFFYSLNPEMIRPTSTPKTIIDCIYFSAATFTTLGYADLSPVGWIRIFAVSEAFFGAISIGFLVAGYSSKNS